MYEKMVKYESVKMMISQLQIWYTSFKYFKHNKPFKNQIKKAEDYCLQDQKYKQQKNW